MLEEDATALRKRVRQRGRADLLVAVQRLPDTALPWEEASRERQAILAAWARLLARFAAGADLVVEATAADGSSLRVIWSAAHGLAAIHRPPAGQEVVLALADGCLASVGPAGRLRTPMLTPQLQFSLRMDPEDATNQKMDINFKFLAAIPGMQLSLEPAACVSMLLQKSSTQRSWDGEVLLLSDEGCHWRIDPTSGFTLRLDHASAGTVRGSRPTACGIARSPRCSRRRANPGSAPSARCSPRA